MIRPIHFSAMGILAIHALAKFFLGHQLMESLNIVPYYFLFLDLVTIPPYVLGWAKLLEYLAQTTRTTSAKTLVWSAITLAASLAPYLYAAWAGYAHFPVWGWIIMGVILLFPIINWIRRLKCLP